MGMAATASEMKPAVAMVAVQVVFGVVNVLYKLAMTGAGMNARVLVAYRYLLAFASLAPLAFFVERKRRPRMTWKILGQSFLCGLFGGALAQNLYVEGMRMTSATFASAMTNLIPAITFILAAILRMESLEIRRLSGKAKIAGTLIGLSGAMLLTFYKGPELHLWPSTKLDLLDKVKAAGYAAAAGGEVPPTGNRVLGSLLVIVSCFSYSIWLIVQTKMSHEYPCPYSSSALMCSMASIQASVYALLMGRKDNMSQWKLGFDVRLLTVVFAGTIASALTFTLIAWCIAIKGPLYASIFNPLMLVVVALLGSLLLSEELHLGSALGAALIVAGLYLVLWGKRRETPTTPRKMDVVAPAPEPLRAPAGVTMAHIMAEEFDEQSPST